MIKMVKEVMILKTQGCISCAQASRIVNKIKEEEKLRFKVKEIDVLQNPEILQKYPILSSPGIVIDGKLEFAGMPSEKKLRERLKG